MKANLQLTVAVYSVIVNYVFVRFMSIKLIYILTALLVEYKTFCLNIYDVTIDQMQ